MLLVRTTLFVMETFCQKPSKIAMPCRSALAKEKICDRLALDIVAVDDDVFVDVMPQPVVPGFQPWIASLWMHFEARKYPIRS